MITFFSKRNLLALMFFAVLSNQLVAQEAATGNPLVLDAKTISEAGIVLDKVVPRGLANELKAPGEVKADAYSTVLITPRVESQVLARQAMLGDVVKTGQPLVRLSSVQVAETQGALIVAEQDWQRIAALGPQAVSARRYNEARVARDQAHAKLRAYGLSDGQINQLLRKGSAAADGSFELIATAAGRITTDSFMVGERVEPGRTLFTLAREDSIWVVGQLPPADATLIKPNAAARILLGAGSLSGKVVGRSHQTDERTRTVPVRIEVDNRQDQLHPGDLVDVRISAGSGAPMLAVPAAAIVLLQNQTTVFIALGKGRFEPAAVTAGATQDGWTVITQGLKAGDSYVRQGAFVLKARLLRSQLGEP